MPEDTKLIQTKTNFMIRGTIEGKDNPANNNGYREGIIEKGKCAGQEFRSIKFKVKTSNDNIIPVELFGMELKDAWFYNRKLKKTLKVDWSKRNIPGKNGYELIVPAYDLVDQINKEFKDGDVVRIVGELQPNTYTDQTGTERHTVRYIIKSVKPSKGEVDFDSSDFKEINQFNQECVINEVEFDNTENKVFISAYVIGYNEKFDLMSFELDMTKAHPLFLKTLKSMKFGDFIKFKGTIHFRVIEQEVDGEFGKDTISDIKKCLEITGADGTSYIKGLYKESDFVKEDINASTINWDEIAKTTNKEEELPFNLD
jgi:hypothetical protein